MKFPEGFIEKFQKLLGDDFEKFLKSFESPASTAFRVNPQKVLPSDLTKLSALAGLSQDVPIEKIPASSLGYYGKISGNSMAHATGLVYSQEPAAQQVGEWAASLIKEKKEALRVLDLCAAPGGKSIGLLSNLRAGDVLVSNEISKSRSKVLVENLERFGMRQGIVTQENPAHLARHFAGYFDLVVVDAPCSGEGMFRKDPGAMVYWKEEYPQKCSLLQRQILQEALVLLKSEGDLLYSTCTWSPEEDEEIVDWLLKTYPDLRLVRMKKFWPHEQVGEGQFIAHLKRSRGEKKSPNLVAQKREKKPLSNLTRENLALWQHFSNEALNVSLQGELQKFGDELYLLPKGLPDLSKLKIARNGLHLGTFKTRRFEPSFALGIALSSKETQQQILLTEEEFKRYASGESLKLTDTRKQAKGWVQVLVAENGFGFAKVSEGSLKNHYPKGLRFKNGK